MVRVVLTIGGHQLDYSSNESLGLSLTKKTDKFFDIVGSEGNNLSGINKSLRLPYSKHNQKCIENASILQQRFDKINCVQDTQITVNGVPIFQGVSTFKYVQRNDHYGEHFVMQLFGDVSAFWSLTESINLCDLTCLGSDMWSMQNIIDSNCQTYDDGRVAIWAPKIYGNLDTSVDDNSNVSANLPFKGIHFRPDIYFKAIIDALVKCTLGFELCSDFMDKEIFKRGVHLYGEGANWKNAQYDADNPFELTISSSNTWNNVAAGGSLGTAESQFIGNSNFIQFDVGTANDPDGWYIPTVPAWWPSGHTGYAFEVQTSGNYSFNLAGSIQANSILDVTAIDLVVFDQNGNVIILETFTPNSSSDEVTSGLFNNTIDEPAEFIFEINTQDYDLVEGYTFFFKVKGGYDDGEDIYNSNFTLNITSSDKAAYNQEVDLASTLPCKPVKDFIRGITHMFGLAWFVNYNAKKVIVEPRFGYCYEELENGLIACDGFYYEPIKEINVVSQAIDARYVKAEQVNPFGSCLVLKYKDDESNPLANLMRNNYTDNDVPPYASKTVLNKLNKTGTTVPNPYFEEFYIANHSQIRSSKLPFLTPDHELNEDALPNPTYNTGPKAGFVYYNATWVTLDADTDIVNLAGWTTMNNNGTYAAKGMALVSQQNIYSQVGQPRQIEFEALDPVTGQPYSAWLLYEPQPVNELYGYQYADVKRFYSTGAQIGEGTIKGLTSIFYMQYLAMLRNGKKITVRRPIKLSEYQGEDFRKPKRIVTGRNCETALLLCINQFNPINNGLTESEYIQYRWPTEEDKALTMHNDVCRPPLALTVDEDILQFVTNSQACCPTREDISLQYCFDYDTGCLKYIKINGLEGYKYDLVMMYLDYSTGNWLEYHGQELCFNAGEDPVFDIEIKVCGCPDITFLDYFDYQGICNNYPQINGVFDGTCWQFTDGNDYSSNIIDNQLYYSYDSDTWVETGSTFCPTNLPADFWVRRRVTTDDACRFAETARYFDVCGNSVHAIIKVDQPTCMVEVVTGLIITSGTVLNEVLEYRLDGAGWQPYTAPFNAQGYLVEVRYFVETDSGCEDLLYEVQENLQACLSCDEQTENLGCQDLEINLGASCDTETPPGNCWTPIRAGDDLSQYNVDDYIIYSCYDEAGGAWLESVRWDGNPVCCDKVRFKRWVIFCNGECEPKCTEWIECDLPNAGEDNTINL